MINLFKSHIFGKLFDTELKIFKHINVEITMCAQNGFGISKCCFSICNKSEQCWPLTAPARWSLHSGEVWVWALWATSKELASPCILKP